MYTLLAVAKGEVPAEFSRVPSIARYRRRLFVFLPVQKRNTAQLLPQILQLKAQAPEVSNDQVIAQDIKALRVGPLHSHLVSEWPKIVPELYEQFTKFSKSEVQHFRKLEQQRQTPKPDEVPRPPRSKSIPQRR
jgi:hypothetical protein